VVGVLHPQDGVAAHALIRPEPDDARERERVAAATGAVGGRGQVRPEGARAAGTGCVRVSREGRAAIGTEVAGADLGGSGAEDADARVKEVEQAAGEVRERGDATWVSPIGR